MAAFWQGRPCRASPRTERVLEMKMIERAPVKGIFAAAGVLALLAVGGAIGAAERRDMSAKNSETTVTTNENGSVSRTFTESTVTTNGNMVTEHRRETRTTMDTNGNVLENSVSEYSQSYSVNAIGRAASPAHLGGEPTDKADGATDSFMGLTFGEVFEGTNFVFDASEPTLRRATFTPKKELADFDDYYVYVTPKSHKIAKVIACAKNVIDPGARWKRHYLIEALEKRYGTWARLCSFSRPCYAFDIGDGRCVMVCLAGASTDYQTVLAAWDESVLGAAAEEQESLRAEARKAAAEKRNRRVSDAADAF